MQAKQTSYVPHMHFQAFHYHALDIKTLKENKIINKIGIDCRKR